MKTLLKKIASKTYNTLKPAEVKLLYALGFNNASGIKKNALYEFYHFLCRYNFKRLNENRGLASEFATSAARTFKRDAVVVLPANDHLRAQLDRIPRSLLEKLEDPAHRTQLGFLTRYIFTPGDFEHIRPLITDQIDATLKEIFKSYYMVVNAYMYRTVPTQEPPRSSFLWHFDDHAECHLKLFFYLTDTYKSNGAIQVHSWKSARDLKKRGFLDRRNVSPGIQKDLNDESRYTIVEGKRGTSFIFCENTIHRAVIPEEKYRDVITLELLPSPNPSLQYIHIGEVAYWQNPFDILFPKPGAPPQGLGYN